MADCIFCKIAQKEIPSTLVYEDELVAAFKDLEPQAPFHALVIPKKHVESIAALKAEDKELTAHILCDVIPQIAKEQGLTEKGFRVVANTGEDGGQTVKHLHFHILGGRSMQWPPG
ncbi:MAG: histidine triad nucleotide-binding protein [Schwartzia succinivorans]|jgi:histidine triad (HIT) family protein|uniref:histidine triad nucleotide-binding protein n=1 Tax=Schwartzia succinivorans TaxID=55507 RepID=UPI0023558AF2|nr:histidine triad nucleotide-binding protein [Schwartzia succinivorans]MBE6097102.1 histidine triad nucleotide-binding protein [Schwartzia succinivorans]